MNDAMSAAVLSLQTKTPFAKSLLICNENKYLVNSSSNWEGSGV